MNERIKELVKQAREEVRAEWDKGNKIPYPEAHYEFQNDNDQKFAELIVAECMEVCRRGKYDGRDDMSLIQFNNGIRFCMNAIDNHFGD